MHIRRSSARKCKSSENERTFLHGAPPFPPAGNLYKMCNYGIEPKRMRLVHPYADKEPNMVLIEGPQRRKTTPRRRPAAHSLHERRGVYGRSTEIVRDEIKGELYVRNIISVCNSDRQPGGHDISLCPYFKKKPIRSQQRIPAIALSF